MSYRSLGNDRIEITLKVYRDFCQGIPGFDAPAYISVFDSLNNRIKDIALTLSYVDTLRIPADSCIDTALHYPCYEVGTYIKIDTLGYIPGGYLFVYDRCCLPANFINITRPLESGTAVIMHIPDTFALNNNQSPYYVQSKMDFACTWTYREIDKQAIELDGDSLHYELITPHNSSITVGPSYGPPKPPPYSNLIFATSYSLSNPFGGYPISFDEDSGKLSLAPVTIGGFLYTIKIEEYRNGRYLGYSENVSFIYSYPFGKDTTDTTTKPPPWAGEEELIKSLDPRTYPNPVRDAYNIEFDEANDFTVELMDQSGRMRLRKNVNSSRHVLNLEHYPEGLYFLIVRSDDAVWRRKILKIE